MSENHTKLTPSSLSALMCARICHDLLNPVGGLGTALEILADESNTDMHEDAMSLIKNSTHQALSKLQFLRLAFGAAGSAPGMIAVSEIKKLTLGVYGEGKATIHWDMGADGLDKSQARLLLNLIMISIQTVPFGGDVTIQSRADAEKVVLKLVSTGRKARLEEAIKTSLSGRAPEDGFDGRTIQPFYTGMMTRELQGRLATSVVEDTVTLQVEVPTSLPA